MDCMEIIGGGDLATFPEAASRRLRHVALQNRLPPVLPPASITGIFMDLFLHSLHFNSERGALWIGSSADCHPMVQTAGQENSPQIFTCRQECFRRYKI